MKFNPTKAPEEPDTVNRAGGESFEQTPKVQLASLLFTSFLEDQYYRSTTEQLEGIEKLIQRVDDPKFAAKAALYARVEMSMRSTSHVVAGEIARSVKGEQWTKHFFERIVVRADDMLEIVAYYMGREGGGLPAAMRKGFAKALRSLDEYELAKYRRARHEWSMHDVVNLVHPEPTAALNKLMNGTLESPETWETRKTQAGQSQEESGTEVWADLLAEERLGYFALLRNLRNIAQEAPDALDTALNQLTNEDRIQGSRILPFRYLTAMDAIDEASGIDTPKKQSIRDALNDALDTSVQNVPEFPGDTAIVLDTSGSMRGRPIRIGSLFAAVLAKANRAPILVFDRTAEWRPVNLSDTTTTIANGLGASGGGTNLNKAFAKLDEEYDRIVILSDMQHWVGHRSGHTGLAEYRDRTGADPMVFSFDLQGYGDMQFPEENVVEVCGWSENALDMMQTAEAGPQAFIDEVESFATFE